MQNILNLLAYSKAQRGDGGPTRPDSEILLRGVGKYKSLGDVVRCVAHRFEDVF